MAQALELAVSDVTIQNLLNVTPLLCQALQSKARGKEDYHAYFRQEEHSIPVDSTKAILRCHVLVSDGNGRPRVAGLAQKLHRQMLDYAIPRRQIAEAFAEFEVTKSSEAVLALEARARGLFTDITNSGEGGEILLYYLGEACGLEGIWKQPHVKILEHQENTLRGLANGAYRFGSGSSLGTSRFN